ncbi:MAG TPA: nuclear transport factor 2 family protein [Thermoanaerobaculaceae bacterium]|nr:nuclear transport factor 2 family protein [Thermoanaerobaculaceae bacterium]
MRKTYSVLLAIAVAVTLATPVHAESNDKIASEVIATVKAEWAALNANNVAEGAKSWSDDFTEFNGEFATRLEGKAMLTRMEEAGSKDPSKTIFSEMANPKVQVYGDVAILSYNFVGITQDKDGKTKPNRAKSTRVYAKQGGKWMLVHANFAPDPLPSN